MLTNATEVAVIESHEIIAATPKERIGIFDLANMFPGRIGAKSHQISRLLFFNLATKNLDYDAETSLLKKRSDNGSELGKIITINIAKALEMVLLNRSTPKCSKHPLQALLLQKQF